MSKIRKEIKDWVKSILIALIIAVLIRNFLFSPSIVYGESMQPTLYNLEYLIVTKLGAPKRFDIIVFRANETENYVKRVIGLPGDRIEYKDDVLYINGKAYDEPYLNEYKQDVIDGPLTNSFTLLQTPVRSEVVPEGHLFVMGDNRRNSKDSRHIGAIPMNKVIGKAKLVIWPFSEMRTINYE